MKRIRALDGPTPGLAHYLERDGEQATWEGFRSHQAGDAYRELVSGLEHIQHGLCGYCEVNIIDNDRQVEHVIPQSDSAQGRAHALDPTNMMVCCKGGTLETSGDQERRMEPVRKHRSCGEAKGKRNLRDREFIDPRDLPALPSLIRVDYNGRIEADADACQKASIAVDRVENTINILGLNVKRLQRAREKHWAALSEFYQEYLDDPQVIQEAARKELLPEEDGRLPRFFSTSRSYFGPVAEEILAEAPGNWI